MGHYWLLALASRPFTFCPAAPELNFVLVFGQAAWSSHFSHASQLAFSVGVLSPMQCFWHCSLRSTVVVPVSLFGSAATGVAISRFSNMKAKHRVIGSSIIAG
jgi:hypothetical protein